MQQSNGSRRVGKREQGRYDGMYLEWGEREKEQDMPWMSISTVPEVETQARWSLR
jgi:hypothetical protein